MNKQRIWTNPNLKKNPNKSYAVKHVILITLAIGYIIVSEYIKYQL